MDRHISIVMPAFRAQATIARAVRSVIDGTHRHFELIIVADDGFDYATELERFGFRDNRVRVIESGNIGGGSPPARNKGMDAARYDIMAILDADDRFAPDKLELCLPLVHRHGLVSTGLNVTDPEGTLLRAVGVGPSGPLTPERYKFTNFSMDSMLVYDRRRADPRFDPSLPCLTDLDFLLKLFETIPACYHIGLPLHDYVKMAVSVSNGPGVTEKMIATKKRIMARLARGHYPLADPAGNGGINRFLEISLKAEQTFVPRPDDGPVLFENHLEPLLPTYSDIQPTT